MKHDVMRTAEKYKNAHNRKRRWQRVVTLLAAIVVFCTTYALILPAITLSVNGGVVLDGGSTVTAYNRFEAEDAVLVGPEITDNVTASGGKSVNDLNQQETITFSFFVTEMYQNCKLRVSYAQNDTRKFRVNVNGTEYTVTGQSTGSWTNFKPHEVADIALQQGLNSITISAVDNAYAPNFDYIEILDSEGKLVNIPQTAFTRFEAEDAVRVGAGSVTKAPNSAADLASGAAFVGGMQKKANSSLTFTFYNPVAYAACTLKVFYTTQNTRAFQVRVNSDPATTFSGKSGDWYNFDIPAIAAASIQLAKGVNTIVIEGSDAETATDDLPNFDYIELTDVDGNPIVMFGVDNVFEAEDAVLEGKGRTLTGDAASNGEYVAEMTKADDSKLTFTFSVPEQYANAQLVVAYMSDTTRNFSVQVNGGAAISSGNVDNNSWDVPSDHNPMQINLNKGTNTIVIASGTSDNLPNIDYIKLLDEKGNPIQLTRVGEILNFDFDQTDFVTDQTTNITTISGTGTALAGEITPKASSSGVTYKVDNEGNTYAHFDGTGGFYWKPNDTLNDPMKLLTDGVSTISMWVRPETLDAALLFAYDNGTNDSDLYSAVNYMAKSAEGNRVLYYKNGDGNTNNNKFVPPQQLTVGEWNLVNIVQETESTVRIYINGVPSDVITISNASNYLSNIINSGDFGSYYLGVNPAKKEDDANKERFTGDLDSFTIYNYALTADEIKAMYDARHFEHEIKIVDAVEVPGATVNVFNYDWTVNYLPQANLPIAGLGDLYQKGYTESFRFFHQDHGGIDPTLSSVDGEGPYDYFDWDYDNDGKSINDQNQRDFVLYYKNPSLGDTSDWVNDDFDLVDFYNGYPRLKEVEGKNIETWLQPYFDPKFQYTVPDGITTPKDQDYKNSNENDVHTYYEGTMENGGGLFRKDAAGYYYYDSAMNAAWYNGTQFELYDHVVRPMTEGDNSNDIGSGNFLPFNQILMDDDDTTNHVTCDYNENLTNATQSDANGSAKQLELVDPTDLWFGMTVEFNFYMPKDGKVANATTGNLEDMVFDFYGDDDVFVVIDDMIVLNIGGIHGALSGTINFATGVVTMEKKTTSLQEIFDLAGVTFDDYSQHNLKFFYMERGGNISYCRLRFNMPTLPANSLTVTKELETEDGVELNETSKNTKYTFRVVKAVEQTDADGNVITDTKGNPVYVATDELFIPAGKTYTILRGGLPTDETGTVGENGYFYLKDGESAQFTDLLNYTGDRYIVQEILPVTADGQYDIKANEEVSPTTKEIEGDYIHVGTTALDKAGTNIVAYTNKVKSPTCTLKITKNAAEGSTFDKDKVFYMQVKLSGELIPVGMEYTVGEEIKTVTEAGVIPLKLNETATITGILAGTDFEVIEVDGATYNVVYTGQRIESDDEIQSFGSSKDSIIGSFTYESNVAITVTNATYDAKVEIPVTKQAPNNSTDATFHFIVERGTWSEGKWEKTGVDNGVAISVEADEVGTSNIFLSYKEDEVGTHTYKVYEQAENGNFIYDDTFYIVKVEVASDGNSGITAKVAEVLKNGTQKEELPDLKLPFKNQATTTVTINKEVTGVAENDISDQEFNFVATIQWDSEVKVTATGADITTSYDDGEKITTVSFKLQHAGKVVLAGIPVGAKVTAEEVNYDGYVPSVQVETVYEAESGKLTLPAQVYDKASVSNGEEVRNVVYDVNLDTAGAVNLSGIIYSETANAKLYIQHASSNERKLGVQVNNENIQELTCAGHDNWSYYDELEMDITLNTLNTEANNSIVLSAVNNGDAPNLDYIRVVQEKQVNVATTTQVVNGATTINFINQTGYQLPNTGSTGTNLYTILGGALLILAATASTLIMYKNRRKEEHASK